MAHIPLFYRIFFLYIHPLICLSGIYLFFFDHQTYIDSGVPSVLSTSLSSASTTPLSPLTNYLITTLGSYSLFVFVMQILLLHGFKDANEPKGLNVRIWSIVQFGILLIDLGLLWSVYVVAQAERLSSWNGGEWANNGILGLVAVIRTAFLLGLGGVGREE